MANRSVPKYSGESKRKNTNTLSDGHDSHRDCLQTISPPGNRHSPPVSYSLIKVLVHMLFTQPCAQDHGLKICCPPGHGCTTHCPTSYTTKRASCMLNTPLLAAAHGPTTSSEHHPDLGPILIQTDVPFGDYPLHLALALMTTA